MVSGKLATEYTPTELVKEKVLLQVHSILYWVDKDNPRGPIPSNPQNDPQFILWETPVRNWASIQGIIDETEAVIPTLKDDVHLPNQAPRINVTLTKKEYKPEETIQIQIQNNSGTQVSQVDFFLNEIYLGTIKNPPYSFSFSPKDLGVTEKMNKVKVVVYDLVGNKGEAEENFTVAF